MRPARKNQKKIKEENKRKEKKGGELWVAVVLW